MLVHVGTTQAQSAGAVSIATAALIRKRAVIAGEIEALDAKLGQLRADLVHLDAAIRIMCPDAEPELIRPRKPSRKADPVKEPTPSSCCGRRMPNTTYCV